MTAAEIAGHFPRRARRADRGCAHADDDGCCVPANPVRPKALTRRPAAPIRRHCPFRPGQRKKKSPWAIASSMARSQAGLARAATARTATVRRRGRRWSTAAGSSATVACNRSRTSSPTALRSRGIIRSRCRRKAARRCQTPTSPPSPLMSGPSAIREGSRHKGASRLSVQTGRQGPWNEERKDHVQGYLRALSRSR